MEKEESGKERLTLIPFLFLNASLPADSKSRMICFYDPQMDSLDGERNRSTTREQTRFGKRWDSDTDEQGALTMSAQSTYPKDTYWGGGDSSTAQWIASSYKVSSTENTSQGQRYRGTERQSYPSSSISTFPPATSLEPSPTAKSHSIQRPTTILTTSITLGYLTTVREESPTSSVIVSVDNAARTSITIPVSQHMETEGYSDDNQAILTVGSRIFPSTPTSISSSSSLSDSVSTGSEDPHSQVEASSSSSSSTSTRRNTWITSTTNEPLSSGVTIIPFPTIIHKPNSSSIMPTLSSTIALSASTNASIIDPTSSLISLSSSTPVNPQTTGAVSSNKSRIRTGVAIGVIVGAFFLLILVGLCKRRDLISKFFCLPCLRSRKKQENARERSSPQIPITRNVNESEENVYRREKQLPDLENATISSGSHYDDESEVHGGVEWADIDIRDPRSGSMAQDNGEWLDAWRRGKEQMLCARQPPELQFNPELPLPPITLESPNTRRYPDTSL